MYNVYLVVRCNLYTHYYTLTTLFLYKRFGKEICDEIKHDDRRYIADLTI